MNLIVPEAGESSIFQMRIELTYPYFFCLLICVQCFLKGIAGGCFPCMFN